MMALALPSLIFLGSCGDETSSDPKPTISLGTGGAFISASQDVVAGTAVTFNVKATAGSGAMKNVQIKAAWGTQTKTILDTALTTKEINFNRSLLALGAAGDDVVYTFTANDGNGQSSSTSVTLSMTPAMASLDGQSGFKVYNASALTLPSAFNLYTAQDIISGTSVEKDILDKTATSAAQWSKTWGSGNGSTFVKVAANDWVNGTSTTYLFNLYKANKAKMTETITGLAKDDVILVRSGQDIPFNLFILKITAVVDLPAVGNHTDYYQFDYRGILK
jgi:hypothetical protein